MPQDAGRIGSNRSAIVFLAFLAILAVLQGGDVLWESPRWNAIAACFNPQRSNAADCLPSVEAARQIQAGRFAYSIQREGASFIYPPVAALLYRPFTGLSDADLGRWIFAVHRLLLVAILAVLLLVGRPRSALEFALLAAAVLLWHPLMRAVELNQAAVFVTLAVGGAVLASIRRRPWAAGVALALAIAVKPPLALALPLLLWHAPATVLASLAAGAALLLVSIAYAGWAAHAAYLTEVLPALVPGYAFHPNQSWNGLLNRLVHPELAWDFVIAPENGLVRWGTIALGLGTLAVFAWAIRGLPRDPRIAPDILLLAWLAATLASPISWEHHYAPALFGAAWLWRRHREGSGPIPPCAPILIGAGLALVSSYMDLSGLTGRAELLLVSFVFAGGWLLAAGWLRLLRAPAFAPESDPGAAPPPRACLPLDALTSARLEQALLAGLVVFGLYVLAQTLLFPYGRDQGIYAVVARTILDGGTPSRDAWDFKPPGVFFAYALARSLFGPPMGAVRLLEALSLLALVAAYVRVSQRIVDSARAGLVAGFLAVVAIAQLEFWHTAQPETFAATALAWVLALSIPATPAASASDASTASRRRDLAWLLAGCCYGLAGLMKPPLLGGVALTPAVIGFYRAQAAPPDRPTTWIRAALRPSLLMAAGCALPLLATWAWFAFHGAVGPMLDALFDFAPRYTRLGLQQTSFPALVARVAWYALFGFTVHIAIGLLFLAALPRIARREREGIVHVAAVLLFPLLGVALQAKLFPYHFAPVLTLLSLLAGWGFWTLWVRVRGSLAAVALAFVALILVRDPRGAPESFWFRNGVRIEALSLPRPERIVRLLDDASLDAPLAPAHAAARWIAEHTAPSDPIYVWGFEPAIYDWSGRRASSRYIHNVPQRAAWSADSRRLLLEDLARARPAVIVLEFADPIPDVTGDESDSQQALATFPELTAFLEGYRSGPRFGPLVLVVDPRRVRP